MTTNNALTMKDAIADAVKAMPLSETPATPAVDIQAEIKRLALENEILRLKAENEKLASGKPNAGLQPGKTETSQTAALKTNGQVADKVNKTPVSAPPVSAMTAKADAKLLEIIEKFKSAPRDDGKVSGTFAVKVHSYFHACGVPETRVREIIESACKRNVISRMGISTKRGSMMLYFDARVRPNSSGWATPAIADSEKSALAEAFGF